ncbi:MAG: hypothetical protein IKX20_00595 [Paludibacteraceae bacterium]|nr:hypothetical protein [Paludibacteraceae bacterium]
MKRILFYCLAILLILPMNAQNSRRHHSVFEDGDDYHFGYISGSVGYSMLQTSMPNAMPVGGVGGSIGAGYEFRNSGLWANVGVQMSFHRSTLYVDPYMREFPGLDTQGKSVTLQYHVVQQDQMEWNYFDVPILIGYYVRGFHVGGGLKVSYAINPVTHTKAEYNLMGLYEMYPEPFHDMPDRGYTTYEYDNRVANQLNVGASLIGEIGYDLLSSMPTRSKICNILKLAFYFEYGLNTQVRKWENPQAAIIPNSAVNPTPATDVTISPYVNTFATPARTVPFFTGVKLTFMVGSSRTARVSMHHGCMCYN